MDRYKHPHSYRTMWVQTNMEAKNLDRGQKVVVFMTKKESPRKAGPRPVKLYKVNNWKARNEAINNLVTRE